MVTVTPVVSGVELTEKLAVATPFALNVGDDVMVLPFGGSYIVVNEIRNTLPTAETLPLNLTVTGGITGASFNSPIIQTEAQSTSDAASTTSTASYSTAMTATLALPTGTWSVAAQGGVALTHSTGGTVNMQVNIDGDQGTARALTANATTAQMMISEHAISGRTGTISITVRFKSSTAGTTAARNPWVTIYAWRTA
jgi:hypothetical protein